MAIIYNGYAKARGFDPIEAPDDSDRIRKEGLQKYANMREALDWNNKQAQRTINNIERSAYKSEQNRQSNFKVRQKINDLYAKAEWRQIQSKIDHAEQKHKNQTKFLKDLQQFTQTGAKLVGQQLAEREYTQKALWKNHTTKYGLDPNIVKEINSLKGKAWKQSMHTTAAYKKLSAQGMSDDDIRQIHGMPAYLRVAIAETDAVRKVRQNGSWYEKFSNESITIGGDTTTFNAAFNSGDPVKLGEALRQLDLKIDEERGEIDPKVFETSGAWKIRDQIHAGYYRQQKVIANRRAKETNAKQIGVIFDSQLIQPGLDKDGNQISQTIHPGQAYLNTILHEAGGEGATGSELAAARQKVKAMLLHDLEKGNRSWDEVRKILDYIPDKPFRGSTKAVSIGDQWKSDRFELEQAGIKNTRHELSLANASSAKWRAAKAEYHGETLEFLYGGDRPPNQEALFTRFQAASEKGYDDSATLIQKEIALNGSGGINAKSGMVRLQAKIASGQWIPAQYITDLNLPPIQKAQAEQLVGQHNRAMPTQGEGGTHKELTTWIQYKLESRLPSKSDFQKSTTALAATREANKLAVNYYKSYIIENGFDKHAGALKYATDMLTKEIEDPTGKWAVKLNPKTKKRDFYGFRADRERDPIELNTSSKISDIRASRSVLDSQEILGQAILREKAENIANGGNGFDIPEAQQIENQTGVSALEQEMRQIAMYNGYAKQEGIPLIPEYSKSYIKKIQDNRNIILPSQQHKLTVNHPATINAAYANSNQPLPYVKHLVDKSKKLIKDRLNAVGGYNNIDVGDGDKDSRVEAGFEFSLTNATLDQVIQLQLNTAGAYKLTPELIKKYYTQAGLSMEDYFTPENQDKLFEVIWRKEGSSYWGEAVLDDQAFLNDAYTSLTSPFNPRSVANVRPELHQYLEVANVG